MTKMRTCSKCGKEYPSTKKFFKPHKNCEDGLERVCKNCVRERDKTYREAHKEEAHAYRKIWDEIHREEQNEYGRQWRKNNPEKRKATVKRYHVKNKEKHSISVNRWQKNNHDKFVEDKKIWRQKNPEKLRAYDLAYHTAKLALPATFTEDDWARSLEYWGHRCAYCGRPIGFWHTLAQDHFIPLSKGGGYTVDNIVPACHGVDGCNNSKHNKNPLEFMTKKFKSKRKAQKKFEEIQAYFAWALDHTTASSNLGSEAE
jgi:hypothetical protein